MTRNELTIIAECVKEIAVSTKAIASTVSQMSKDDVDSKMDILSALQHISTGNVKLSKFLEEQGEGIFITAIDLPKNT